MKVGLEARTALGGGGLHFTESGALEEESEEAAVKGVRQYMTGLPCRMGPRFDD